MAEAAKRLVDMTADDLQRVVDAAVAKALAAKAANEPAQLLTTKQAAAYLGVSVRVLHGHVAAGRLRPDSPQRPGFSSHRFYRSTLDSFMVKR